VSRRQEEDIVGNVKSVVPELDALGAQGVVGRVMPTAPALPTQAAGAMVSRIATDIRERNLCLGALLSAWDVRLESAVELFFHNFLAPHLRRAGCGDAAVAAVRALPISPHATKLRGILGLQLGAGKARVEFPDTAPVVACSLGDGCGECLLCEHLRLVRLALRCTQLPLALLALRDQAVAVLKASGQVEVAAVLAALSLLGANEAPAIALMGSRPLLRREDVAEFLHPMGKQRLGPEGTYL